MDPWFSRNSLGLLLAVSAGAAVLLVAALVLLVLWLRARRDRSLRVEAERDLLDLELLAAEQGSRMTIVRELQEVAIQAITGIIGHADGARYAASSDPGVAVRAAGAIADSARAARADLRRALDIVRIGEEAAGPQPRLSSVRELFKVMRDAGLGIEFSETGERFELQPGAEVAVNRILQEALANALRHGGPGTNVRIDSTWSAAGLELLVDDDGARASARRAGLDPDEAVHRRPPTQEEDLAALTRPPAGRGITEMRERTELFGGVFTAKAVPGVGFSVSAVFPGLAHIEGAGSALHHG